MISSVLVGTAQQTRHLLLEAVVRRFPGRQLGVGALRPRLRAGRPRLAASPPDAGGAGVSFKIPACLNGPAICMQALSNSTAPPGVNTIRATTCRLPVGLAGREISPHPSGSSKVRVEASGRRKRTGSVKLANVSLMSCRSSFGNCVDGTPNGMGVPPDQGAE